MKAKNHVHGNVLGPFKVTRGTSTTLAAIIAKKSELEKMSGPLARINVDFWDGKETKRFRATVISVSQEASLFGFPKTGPKSLNRSRILIDCGNIRGIAKTQFAVIEMDDRKPPDRNGKIRFFLRDKEIRSPSHYDLLISRVMAKNDTIRIDFLLRGNSLIVRGFETEEQFEEVQFSLDSICEIIEKLENANLDEALQDFTVLAKFFGNDQSEGRLFFNVDVNADTLKVTFQKLRMTQPEYSSEPFQVSFSRILREMIRIQETLMILYRSL